MLVITRKSSQSVRVGSATVTVIGINPDGGVKLGITAPKDVPIWRTEIDDGQGAHTIEVKTAHAIAFEVAAEITAGLYG
jgi:carbon storage regulator CsrA